MPDTQNIETAAPASEQSDESRRASHEPDSPGGGG